MWGRSAVIRASFGLAAAAACGGPSLTHYARGPSYTHRAASAAALTTALDFLVVVMMDEACGCGVWRWGCVHTPGFYVCNTSPRCTSSPAPAPAPALRLVYTMDVAQTPEGGFQVDVAMTLTAPGCGMGPAIAEDAKGKILLVPGVSAADVRITWEPAWNQSMISEEGKMKLGLI